MSFAVGIVYCIILAFLVFLTVKKPGSYVRFIVKIILSSLVVLIYCFNAKHNGSLSKPFFLLLLIAFILSFIGDIFLGLYNLKRCKITKLMFVLGASMFYIAHFFFIHYFISMGNLQIEPWSFIFPTVFMIVIIYLCLQLQITDKVKFIICCIYSLQISSMAQSAVVYFATSTFSTCVLFALIGGVLFAISDFTLLFKYFTNGKNHKFYVISSTICYFIAQLSLAFMVF